jgi:L-proline amide hydrolase
MNTKMPTKESLVSFRGYNTWYRIAGDDEIPGKLPLLCLHGGPGGTHDYFQSLEAMTATGRRVISYDQLGWGNSDHVQNPSLWTIDLFLEELETVCRTLNLERIHILGHSWGGMLALEYALRRPTGLASLILADTTASTPQWISETNRLVSELPSEVQQTIREHEAKGTTNAPEYQEACRVFSRRHGGGHIDPKPEWVRKAFEKLDDNEVYLTMWGPSEFCATGVLKDWDITDRLGEIRTPTLVIAGRHDEATPILAETLHQGIPDSESAIFENSAHFPHIEETERYLQVLDQFLSVVEAKASGIQ